MKTKITSMDDKAIREQLRNIRKSRGLTLEKLAAKVGVEQQQISRMERGDRRLTLDYLLKISKTLNIPLQEIIEVSGANQPNMIARNVGMNEVQYDEILDNMIYALEKLDNLLKSYNLDISLELRKYLVSKIVAIHPMIKEGNFSVFLDRLFNIIDEFMEKLVHLKKNKD